MTRARRIIEMYMDVFEEETRSPAEIAKAKAARKEKFKKVSTIAGNITRGAAQAAGTAAIAAKVHHKLSTHVPFYNTARAYVKHKTGLG